MLLFRIRLYAFIIMWTVPIFLCSQFPTCRCLIYQTHIHILTDKNAGLINQAPTNKLNSLAKKKVDLINQVSPNKKSSYVKKSADLMNQIPIVKKY